jgi:hypothetical protein
MAKKMSWLIGLLIGLAIASTAGGTAGGYYWGKNNTQKKYKVITDKMLQDIDSTRMDVAYMRGQVDSLQRIAPKIDTVIQYQLQVIERIDTVVMTTVEILQYSRLIKADTDTIKNILKTNDR